MTICTTWLNRCVLTLATDLTPSFTMSSADTAVFAFVIAVAAAEAAISLALVILLYKNRQSLDVDEYKVMKG